jgi:heme exporter protein A
VLSNVSLKVSRGETVAVLGPNGAGKSTLLKILATITKPSAGELRFGGMALPEKSDAVRRRIGMLGHQSFLYRNLSGYENLVFYAKMYDVPHRHQRIREVAALVGMDKHLEETVGNLSRGMEQRLAIARALLHQPGFLLLDEPDTGLDQQSSETLWQALQDDGRTIIFTTHDLRLCIKFSERVLILHRGRIVYRGTTRGMEIDTLRDIYRKYTEYAD